MKRALLLILAALALILTACGSTAATAAPAETTATAAPETPAPAPDLSGEWKQSNADGETYHSAVINGDSMEIYWVNPGKDTKSLYWAGTFTAPDSAEPYSWTSANDKDKTSRALLASSDDTKTFSYNNGMISYEAAAMGITKTVKLEKVK